MDNNKEIAAELLKTETANQFKADLLQNGCSEESANDLMRHASFDAVEVFGTLKPVVRDTKNNQIIDSKDLIANLEQQFPSYFGAGSTETNGDVATLSEHHVLDILEQVKAGKIQQLDASQKAAIRAGIKSLENKEGGITIKKLGDYSAMDIHKLCKKVGGLIQ